jgi:hypothetical protein
LADWIKDEIYKVCSTHRRDKKCVQSFDLKSLKKTDHLEYLAIDGRIMNHREIKWDLAQDRDQWQDLVKTVMELHVPH